MWVGGACMRWVGGQGMCAGRTIVLLLPLAVLVQLEDVEQDLAGEADLAAVAIGREERGGRVQGGQAAAGHAHRVQRRPRVPPAAARQAALAAAPAVTTAPAPAIRGHVTPAGETPANYNPRQLKHSQLQYKTIKTANYKTGQLKHSQLQYRANKTAN